MKAFQPVAVGLIGWLAFSAALRAEEKNGVSLVVVKKTLERNDTRSSYVYSDRIDRTQALKATIRNTSTKPQPEGEVKWTILVRRFNYSPSELMGTTGTEKLKALKSAEITEMVMGAAQITGYTGYDSTKDKMDYQIIVTHARSTKSPAVPSISARDNGHSSMISIRPASDSVMPGVANNRVEPVSTKRPGRRSRSTVALIERINAGTNCTSSMINVFARRSTNPSGSSIAARRCAASSSVTNSHAVAPTNNLRHQRALSHLTGTIHRHHRRVTQRRQHRRQRKPLDQRSRHTPTLARNAEYLT